MKQHSFESFGQVRALVGDLFRVRPAVYWTDLAVTMIVAWGSFWLTVEAPWEPSARKIGWLLLSAFAFFRGSIFIHEIAHIKDGRLPWFRRAWNLVCGMVLFIPDYTYIPHDRHHNKTTYSTREDPEYLPLAGQPPAALLAPFLVFPLFPLGLGARFLVLGPASLIVGGRFREWVLRNASTLKMNAAFVWTDISDGDRRKAAVQDLCCLAWWAGFLGLCFWLGRLDVLLDWYLVALSFFVINHLRVLGRHRYQNISGDRVGHEEQLLDSVTVAPPSPLGWIFMPVGLRYHSIHHMLPTLPYHALGAAHRRLVRALPGDHPYMQTLAPGFVASVLRLFTTHARRVRVEG